MLRISLQVRAGCPHVRACVRELCDDGRNGDDVGRRAAEQEEGDAIRRGGLPCYIEWFARGDDLRKTLDPAGESDGVAYFVQGTRDRVALGFAAGCVLY
jgi:hypothetical protein